MFLDFKIIALVFLIYGSKTMLKLQDKDWFMALTSILTIVFLVLKLFDVIQWSWWWVFAPLWMPISIQLVLNLIIVQIYRMRN